MSRALVHVRTLAAKDLRLLAPATTIMALALTVIGAVMAGRPPTSPSDPKVKAFMVVAEAVMTAAVIAWAWWAARRQRKELAGPPLRHLLSFPVTPAEVVASKVLACALAFLLLGLPLVWIALCRERALAMLGAGGVDPSMRSAFMSSHLMWPRVLTAVAGATVGAAFVWSTVLASWMRWFRQAVMATFGMTCAYYFFLMVTRDRGNDVLRFVEIGPFGWLLGIANPVQTAGHVLGLSFLITIALVSAWIVLDRNPALAPPAAIGARRATTGRRMVLLLLAAVLIPIGTFGLSRSRTYIGSTGDLGVAAASLLQQELDRKGSPLRACYMDQLRKDSKFKPDIQLEYSVPVDGNGGLFFFVRKRSVYHAAFELCLSGAFHKLQLATTQRGVTGTLAPREPVFSPQELLPASVEPAAALRRRRVGPDEANARLQTDLGKDGFQPTAWPAGAATDAVLMEICVSEWGVVLDARILQSTGEMRPPDVIEKIRRWDYRPLTIDGTAVRFCTQAAYARR